MTWPHPSTHRTTHPPTKPHTHPWVGNSSQISNLQTELKYLDQLKCYRILSDSGGLPPLGGWQMGGWRWGLAWVCRGVFHACPHADACTHMHMHVKHAKHRCLHVGGHLQFLYMYKCACVHVHACTCMCVCVGTPPHAPRCPPTDLPPPQSRREPKTPKFNKSWTNWDNSILLEDSLPLNIPELI